MSKKQWYNAVNPRDYTTVCYVLCFSESHQSPVSQRALIPVVRQLDSCQSEAVVGSSSDVASPSRSRYMSSDIEDHGSPATSPEADSHVPVKRPAPRGLVDALSRYFTPSDKRRSRVSLNALPHASPRSLSSDSHSLTSAADTTHTDDTLLPTLLPPKRHHRKMSDSTRPSFWKRGNATDLSSNNTYVHSISGKTNTGDFKPGNCDSPTSVLSPDVCLPSELKPEVVSNPVCMETFNEEPVNSEAMTAEETSAKDDEKDPRDDKPRKRRKNQLSSLQDSLSHLFTAEGERKRTPAQYIDSEFLFETYQPFHYHVKRQRSSTQSEPMSPLQLASDQVKVLEPTAEPAAAASWLSTCYRSPGYTCSYLLDIHCRWERICSQFVDWFVCLSVCDKDYR